VPNPQAGAQTPHVRMVCPALKQEPKRHVCAGMCPTRRHSPSTTCALGCAQPQAGAQAPRVPTWFFFNSINNFLKFINDDNNNTNSNF